MHGNFDAGAMRSVRTRIFRWVLLPVLAATSVVGVAAYAYTCYQMLPLRTDWAIATGMFLPHKVIDNLWETRWGLEGYVEYLQTGSIKRFGADPDDPGRVPALLDYPSTRRLFGQVTIYVPNKYRNMNVTQLQMEIRDFKIRTQLAGVLDRRADVLDRILIFAAALAVTLALWHALTLLARRF